jgi:hypothetical protein
MLLMPMTTGSARSSSRWRKTFVGVWYANGCSPGEKPLGMPIPFANLTTPLS